MVYYNSIIALLYTMKSAYHVPVLPEILWNLISLISTLFCTTILHTCMDNLNACYVHYILFYDHITGHLHLISFELHSASYVHIFSQNLHFSL